MVLRQNHSGEINPEYSDATEILSILKTYFYTLYLREEKKVVLKHIDEGEHFNYK